MLKAFLPCIYFLLPSTVITSCIVVRAKPSQICAEPKSWNLILIELRKKLEFDIKSAFDLLITGISVFLLGLILQKCTLYISV